MVGFWIDSDTARSRIRNGARRFEGFEVKDQDFTAAGNIEAAAIVVGINVVDSTGAHSLGGFDDLVILGGWG